MGIVEVEEIVKAEAVAPESKGRSERLQTIRCGVRWNCIYCFYEHITHKWKMKNWDHPRRDAAATSCARTQGETDAAWCSGCAPRLDG